MRAEQRAQRLLEAHERLAKKLEAEPTSLKAEAWRRKLAGYETSLENLQKFGSENLPSQNKGLDIQMPAKRFSLKRN